MADATLGRLALSPSSVLFLTPAKRPSGAEFRGMLTNLDRYWSSAPRTTSPTRFRKFVSQKASPFEEHRTDLALKLAHRPVPVEAFILVERAFPEIVEMQKLDPMGPGEPQDVFVSQGSGIPRYGIRHRR